MIGRSVRLDIHAVDTVGKKYNIEVQRADKGAGAKRARYHSSVIDANSLLPGSEFIELPETYVIFITEKDVMNGNKAVYHVDRIVKETGKNFEDEAHIIYANGAYQDEIYYKILADKTRYFKEDEKGVAAMCKIMEDLIDSEKKEIALKMLEDGKLQKENIVKYVGITLEQVKELERSHPV